MNQTYTITQLAQMSMLTDRTLRNYLKRGLLHGEKTADGWRFSLEDITAFWQLPAVRQAMEARHLAVAEDFLHQRMDTSGQACFVLDEAVENQQAADALCACVLQSIQALSLQMAYQYRKGMVRLSLRGPWEDVLTAARELRCFLSSGV